MSQALEQPGASPAPGGESLRQALRWVSARRQETPAPSLALLVQEASRHCDLSPKEEHTLWALLTGSSR